MSKNNILIIDDEIDMQETLKSILNKKFNVFLASSGKQGLAFIEKESFSLVLLDLRMPQMNGTETLKQIKKTDELLPVIILTASKDLKSAIECMKLGAEDYINKPFEVEELITIIEKSIQKSDLIKENMYLKESIAESKLRYGKLIGESMEIKKIRDLIKTIAETDSTILISGESGSGKEIVANDIHNISNRRNNSFVAINCAAIPENLLESELFGYEKGAFTGAIERKIGKFERANNGTLFLDEIGYMSPNMQSKLLRVLEEKKFERLGGNLQVEINVRIIAATNINFENHIKEGKFREDLYYRLNVIPIRIPPLRERKEDLNLLISYFIDQFNKEFNKNIKGVSKLALEKLKSYTFPGNVRELKNIIERAMVLTKGALINEDQIFSPFNLKEENEIVNLNEACKEFEKKIILQMLKKCDNNQLKAAKNLGIPRTTLSSKLEALNMRQTK